MLIGDRLGSVGAAVKGGNAALVLLALAFVVPVLVIVMVVGGSAPPCDQQAAGGSGGGPGTGALAAGGIPVAFVPLIQKAGALDPAFPAPVLAAQIQQESGFHASAVSSTGAMGTRNLNPDLGFLRQGHHRQGFRRSEQLLRRGGCAGPLRP